MNRDTDVTKSISLWVFVSIWPILCACLFIILQNGPYGHLKRMRCFRLYALFAEKFIAYTMLDYQKVKQYVAPYKSGYLFSKGYFKRGIK